MPSQSGPLAHILGEYPSEPGLAGTCIDRSPGNGTGWATRRIFLNQLSNQKRPVEFLPNTVWVPPVATVQRDK